MITWNITVDSANGTAKFESRSAATTILDLTQVIDGDYVNISGTQFAEGNTGSFPVIASSVAIEPTTGILVQWFVILNDSAAAQANLDCSEDDILFYRPERATIHETAARSVVVAQAENGVLDILIPATAAAVGRTALTAAYAQQRPITKITSLTRDSDGTVTVSLPSTPNVVVNGQIVIDGVYGDTVAPPVAAGNTVSGYTDATLASHWHPLRALTGPHTNHALVQILNGDVWVVGGMGEFSQLNTIDAFRVIATTVLTDGSKRYSYDFLAGPTLNTARQLHTAVLHPDTLLNGMVIIAGGHNDTNGILNSIEYIAAGSSSTTVVTGALRHRAWHTCDILLDGRVLLAGGLGRPNNITNTCDLWDPHTGTVTNTGNLKAPRAGHRSVTLSDGRVLVIGGRAGTVAVAADAASSGVIAIDGTNSVITDTCEVYSPVTGLWSTVGRMSYAREYHTAVLLPDDRVLVVGGIGTNLSQGGTDAVIDRAELWDPKTGRWAPAGRMSVARYKHLAHLLPNTTKVLVANGVGCTTSEYYDYETGRWGGSPAATDALPNVHSVLMASGTVFASDGTTPRLFNHASDTFGSGKVNGMWNVTAVGLDTVKFHTPENQQYLAVSADSAPTATPVAVTAGAQLIAGPFVFDTLGGAAVTTSETTLLTPIAKGQQYRSIVVGDTSKFPDGDCWLAIGYGTEDVVTPVKCFGKLSASELVLDYSFKFTKTIPKDAKVILLSEKGAFVPTHPELVGSFYATASSAGRVAASAALDGLVAAGITVNKTIQYPGDRGLGGEGLPATGTKISDKVAVWGGDDLDAELNAAKGEE